MSVCGAAALDEVNRQNAVAGAGAASTTASAEDELSDMLGVDPDSDIPFYERVLNRLCGPDTIELDETDFWTGQIALAGGLPALYNSLTAEETKLVLNPAVEQLSTSDRPIDSAD